MGFISRFFTGAPPSNSKMSAANSSVASLRRQVEKLETANEKYRERMAERIGINESLRETAEMHKAELNAVRMNSRSDLTLERTETFFTGIKLSLPEEAYTRFLAKYEDMSTPARVEGFRKEMEMAQDFDFNSLQPVITFQRSETDIACAEEQGITLDKLKANQIRITKERFDDIIKKSFIKPEDVKTICEIGSAWRAATRYMIETTSIRNLKGLLANYFPRRSFGYISQHCLDTSFPEDKFEKLIKDPTKVFGYHVYRKL